MLFDLYFSFILCSLFRPQGSQYTSYTVNAFFFSPMKESHAFGNYVFQFSIFDHVNKISGRILQLCFWYQGSSHVLARLTPKAYKHLQ